MSGMVKGDNMKKEDKRKIQEFARKVALLAKEEFNLNDEMTEGFCAYIFASLGAVLKAQREEENIITSSTESERRFALKHDNETIPLLTIREDEWIIEKTRLRDTRTIIALAVVLWVMLLTLKGAAELAQSVIEQGVKLGGDEDVLYIYS